MKRIIGVTLLLLFSIPAFNQESAYLQQQPVKETIVKKGNNTLEWLLTGGGAALIVTGIAMHDSKKTYSSNNEIGTALIIAGSASIATGIVLFSSSPICMTGEKEIALQLKVENAVNLEQAGRQTAINRSFYPALSLRWGL
jgi:hypothetical protein